MKKILICLLLMSTTVFAQEKGFIIPTANDGETTTITQGTQPVPLQVQQGSRPVPDPTALTTEAVNKLKTELVERFNIQFGEVFKEINRLIIRMDQQPDNIRTEILNLDKLVNEKFKGLVDQQIQRDNNLALALTAAQKSVTDTNQSNITAANKAEQSFKDQIAATQLTITDLKDRITRIESASSGAGGAINWVIAGISILIAIIGGIIGIVSFLRTPVPLPVVQYVENNGNSRKTR